VCVGVLKIWACPRIGVRLSGPGVSLQVLPRIGVRLSGCGLSAAPPHADGDAGHHVFEYNNPLNPKVNFAVTRLCRF